MNDNRIESINQCFSLLILIVFVLCMSLLSLDNLCVTGDVVLYNFICLIVVPVFNGDNPKFVWI